MNSNTLQKADLTQQTGVIEGEFADANLGDGRLDRRLTKIVGALWERPDQGFPQALAAEAEAEGFYRFMVNPRVEAKALLTPHLEASAARAAQLDEVLAIHDTTQFAYSTSREGLGRLSGGKNGYLLHASLLVSDPEARTPLGLGTVLPWVRTGKLTSKTESGRKLSGHEYAKLPDRESRRWFDCAVRVEERLVEHSSTAVIHVADREGDSYELFSKFLARESRFVVRLYRDRIIEEVDGEGTRVLEQLKEVVQKAETVCEREVALSRRKASPAPRSAKTHPARKGRIARLGFAACQVAIRRPKRRRDLPESITLNVVYVCELDAPAGEDPVEWLLATTEPVDTVAQILHVVDIYRTRWIIEEYFKALKTGCKLEERQLESYDGLLRAFAIFAPIAWQMLRLRALSRVTPEAPAAEILTESQLAVLKGIAKTPLSPRPTGRQALFAIARLGGHLRSNGDPGWLTLARGMVALAQAHVGWVACRAAMAAGQKM